MQDEDAPEGLDEVIGDKHNSAARIDDPDDHELVETKRRVRLSAR
jgi:hypothetical protein